MKLKALLVDDEVNILRNLESVLPWEELGVEVIGLAKNGVQALEMAQEHRPELILCDIRMPVLDGIGFLEKLRESESDAQVVMLTGYQDFEYARSVIRHGVRDYILKPIDYDELTAVVQRLADEARERLDERRSEEKRLGEAMVLAYEKLLHDVLMDYASVTANAPYLYEGEFDLAHLRFRMMVVRQDQEARQRAEVGGKSEQERKLWNFAVRNVLQEALRSEGLRYAVLQTRDGEWCVLIEAGREYFAGGGLEEEVLRRWAERLQRAVREHVKIRLSVGVYLGDDASVRDLPAVYKTLQRMLLMADEGAVVVSGETESARTKDLLMDAAKEYMERHLAKDLGIDELADYLDISASYFSLLFKQRFGVTFVEYLTAERMELAKSLLVTTDRSVTDIGRSVGYMERRYFTKVFLKRTGEIPSEYRERRRGATGVD